MTRKVAVCHAYSHSRQFYRTKY